VEGAGRGDVTLDGHHSTAEVKPTNKFGSSMSVGTAIFGVQNQSINFDNDLPVISYTIWRRASTRSTRRWSHRPATRSATPISRTRSIRASWLFTTTMKAASSTASISASPMSSNKVRSAFGTIQNDTWGGIGPASSLPDDMLSIVDAAEQVQGASRNPAWMIQKFYTFNFEQMVDLLESKFQACSHPRSGAAIQGTCLAQFDTDRRILEKTLASYAQVHQVRRVRQSGAHRRRRALRIDRDNVVGAGA
jgi:hypothetical protein